MPVLGSRRSVVAALRAAGCVFAEDEAALLVAAARTLADLDALVARRAGGLPLEQVLGWAEFCGKRTVVEPGVFVPRRRTEFLVDRAVAVARPVLAARPTLVVADLCCGSGAVGAALVAALDAVELHAVDIDPVAVGCARRNLAGYRGLVHQGDLYEPLPATLRGRVDVVVAVAPYVPTGAIRLMPPEARLYESRAALDGGTDGLDVVQRVIVAAPGWLTPGGALLVEVSGGQATATADAMTDAGLTADVHTPDGDGIPTVVIGVAPGGVRTPGPGAG